MEWYAYERELAAKGYNVICGVDEAGRGPLAGPVFAAAVVLDPKNEIEGLNDSKKLSQKKRELLFDEIREKALDFGIWAVDEKTIDEINILQATFLAMTRATEQLETVPDIAVIDGNRLPPAMPCECMTLVKGDSLCTSVAAASILAKVSRDRFMMIMHEKYPEYNFAKHKGYGTKEHCEAILKFGPSPVHRRSFLKKLLPEESTDE